MTDPAPDRHQTPDSGQEDSHRPSAQRTVFSLPTWMYYFFWAFLWLLGFGILAFSTDNYGHPASWGYVLCIICISLSVIFSIIIGYGVSQSHRFRDDPRLAHHIIHGSRIWALTWAVAFLFCELAFNTVAAQYNFNSYGTGIMNCLLISALVGIMYLSGSAIFADTPMFIVGLVLLVETLIIPAFRVPRGYWITAVISGAALLIAGIVDYLTQTKTGHRAKADYKGTVPDSQTKTPSPKKKHRSWSGFFKKKSKGQSPQSPQDQDSAPSQPDTSVTTSSTSVPKPSSASTRSTSRPTSRTSNWD